MHITSHNLLLLLSLNWLIEKMTCMKNTPKLKMPQNTALITAPIKVQISISPT